MMTRNCLVAGFVLFLLFSLPAVAGWWEVAEADANFNLGTAREFALATIKSDPKSADAVAAAMWWFAQLEEMPAPEEILTAATKTRDPELGFVLSLIEAELSSRPPAVTLTDAELAGPFGVFSTLDLERGVVPPDDELPPPNTPWQDPTLPFRLRLKTANGRQGPPMSMAVDGVYLVGWNLEAETEVEGWLVVEAEGGINLEMDGRIFDQLRNCGQDDPGANWYRVRLGAGSHRLRVELGGSGRSPLVRLNLLDQGGRFLAGVTTVELTGANLAASEVEKQLPPATAALMKSIQSGKVGENQIEMLLAAFLARGRGDIRSELEFLEQMHSAEPENPWPALALSRHLYLKGQRRGVGGEVERRTAELLQVAAEIPSALLLDRALAVRESRQEDAERIVEKMAEEYGDDVRVLRILVQEAVRRGWAREAEEGLARLEAALPESTAVTGLRLDVLASLERWREREENLQALASAVPVEARWIGQLTSSCMVDEAIAATEALLADIENPDFSTELVTFHLNRGDLDAARTELDRARAQWGDLRAFDELELVLAAGDRQAMMDVLAGVLARDPSNLQLLTLAWRWGEEPFFEQFRVEAREFAEKNRDLEGDSDVTLLLDQAVERIQSDGSSLYYYHGLTRANTSAGTRRASVLQPLPDSYFLKVRILKPDGRVVVPGDLQVGQGVISLNDVRPGDLVEEEYVAEVAATGASRRGHLPPYIYRFADPDRAFGLSEYVLLVPPEIDLQVDGNFEGLDRTEEEWRGLRKLRWGAERVQPMPTEPFAPPAQDLLPWLNYGFGVSWQDVGDVVRDRVLPVLRSSRDLRIWSQPFFSHEEAQAVVQALVDSVVESVEAGGGELEMRSTAAESFSRRRGNRLGIIAAVLAEADWDVDLVLTRPWTQKGRRLQVPTLDAFPAAVLRVSNNGEEVWIDIREERRGVNHISPLFQGADGLVLPLTRPQEPVTLLSELPSFPNPDLEEVISVRVQVSSEGNAQVLFRMPLYGARAEALLERVSSVPEDQVAMVFRQMAVNIFPGADNVRGEIERVDSGAMMELNLSVSEACEMEEEELVCRVLTLSTPMVPVFASLPERKHPLVLRVPLMRQLELEFVEPPGWRLNDRAPRQLNSSWGSVTETLEREGNSVRSVLRVGIQAQTVDPENYPLFARFCQAVDELTIRPPRMRRVAE